MLLLHAQTNERVINVDASNVTVGANKTFSETLT